MTKLIFFSFVATISLNLFAGPNLKSIEGKSLFDEQAVSVSSQGKEGLVVVFLSSKCPCSNSHNEELRELANKYLKFSFVAVHSNADEAIAQSKPYFEKAQFPFPVIDDSKGLLADQLQALKTPHAFVFSQEGKLLYQGGVSNSKDCGKSDRKYLREALNDISLGQAVKTPEGRTLGCSISRGENNVW